MACYIFGAGSFYGLSQRPVPGDTVIAADGGWLAVGALELKFWQGVCAVLGRDDWAARHWSLGEEAPGSEAARALIDELAALIASRPLAVLALAGYFFIVR